MILYCMGASCQLGAASGVLPLHAGYRGSVRCQAAFCHSREGGNPFLDPVIPAPSVIPPPSISFQCEGYFRRRNVIPECFCRGRESSLSLCGGQLFVSGGECTSCPRPKQKAHHRWRAWRNRNWEGTNRSR